MKELILVRVQYASRQQCCKTHKRPLSFYILPTLSIEILSFSLNPCFSSLLFLLIVRWLLTFVAFGSLSNASEILGPLASYVYIVEQVCH